MSAPTCSTEIAGDRTEAVALLETRLQCQLSGRIRGFGLRTDDEGLILLGRAHTYYAKQLAQQAVMTATDWPIAANEILVD